jgi:hypothetical protein
VLTARQEELDLTGDTRITDRLARPAVCEEDTFGSGYGEGAADSRASAARPSEESDCGRHRWRGAGEESGGDKGDVELHYGAGIEQLLKEQKNGSELQRTLGEKGPTNLIESRKRSRVKTLQKDKHLYAFYRTFVIKYVF